VTPTLTTTVKDASTDTGGTSFALATAVYDSVSASDSAEGTVSWELFKGGTCGGGGGTSQGTDGPTSLSSSAADSSDTSALHADTYYFVVSFDSADDGSWNDTSTCEDFTITTATPTVTTTLLDDSDVDVSTGAVLGSVVHDTVSVTGIGVVGFEPTGTVDFTMYGDNSAGATNDADCTTTNDPSANIGDDVALDGNDPGSAESSDTSPLHAGDFAFDAAFTDTSGDYEDATSACETLTVSPADTTTVTEVRNANEDPGTNFGQGALHDAATVDTDGYAGFDLGPSTDGVDVVFTLYEGSTCSGDVVAGPQSVDIDGLPPQTVLSSETTLDPGFYSYKAVYDGNSDYNTSTGDCEAFTVIPTFTRGRCGFDLSEEDGQQFRLIYTPIPTTTLYRLSASNPGEFYYNAVVTGTPGDDFTLDITFPYPWVTKGLVPTHMWGGLKLQQADGMWCVDPQGGNPQSDPDQILMSGYVNDVDDDQTLEVNGVIPETGLAFIRVHMDFGLKGTSPWLKGASNQATNSTLGSGVTLFDPQGYAFLNSAGGTAVLESINVFKRDPGIAGLVTTLATGDPVVGANVRIYNAKGALVANLTTDSDGWYLWSFKFSGKMVTFTVAVPAFSQSTTFTMTGKQFVIVSFQV
jgi:hypothetical protein